MADVQLTITIPDEHVTRLVDAICGQGNRTYLREKNEEETRPQFAERKAKQLCISRLKTTVIQFERSTPEDIPIQ